MEDNILLSRYRLTTFELLTLSRHEMRIIVGPLTGHCHLRYHLYWMKIYQGSLLSQWCEVKGEAAKDALLECKTLSLWGFRTLGYSEFEKEDMQRGPIGAFRRFMRRNRALNYETLDAPGMQDNILLTITKSSWLFKNFGNYSFSSHTRNWRNYLFQFHTTWYTNRRKLLLGNIVGLSLQFGTARLMLSKFEYTNHTKIHRNIITRSK